ncbi:MAG: hypothetical protein AAGH19_06985, partial [Pseudomonadota bacterium]
QEGLVDGRTEVLPLAVYGNGVADEHLLECHTVTVKLARKAEYRGKYAPTEIMLARIHTQILDLPNNMAPTPEFNATFGGPPQAIAVVFAGGESSGSSSIWLKAAGRWTFLRYTSHVNS